MTKNKNVLSVLDKQISFYINDVIFKLCSKKQDPTYKLVDLVYCELKIYTEVVFNSVANQIAEPILFFNRKGW